MGLSLLYKKPKVENLGMTAALVNALTTDSIVWKFGMLFSLVIVAGTDCTTNHCPSPLSRPFPVDH